MTELGLAQPRATLRRADRVWLAILALLALQGALSPVLLPGVAADAARALAGTLPFIAVAVLAVAGLRATGAETLVARAFEGREARMIVVAALAGGITPFCSCEVIPFVAAMLALGAPLSAAMAFWLASPLMDPAQFALTAGTLGVPFAAFKAGAAVAIGLGGGIVTAGLMRLTAFADPLRPERRGGGCCARRAFSGRPHWRFWQAADRRAMFADTARDNGLFLLKWLTLAYVLEALMTRHVPAEWIAGTLGGDGAGTVVLAALIGAPAYINGYAAPALVAALVEQGMSQGAAMAFMVAGGVSCIPAAIAVWALVRPRVFAAYAGLGAIGALAAGFAWAAAIG